MIKESFVKNARGHYELTIRGRRFTGAEEAKKLTGANSILSSDALFCLTSQRPDGYDALHRLEIGPYRLVLAPSSIVQNDDDRSPDNVLESVHRFGYRQPRAGVLARCSELITNAQMADLGFKYIAVPHRPITGANGAPRALTICAREPRVIEASWSGDNARWPGFGAFVFEVG